MSAAVHIAAADYLKLGFQLVPLAPGQKLPRVSGCQKNPIADFAQLGDAFSGGRGIGLHHGASRTASLDIDNLELTRQALMAVSINLDNLLDAPGPKIHTSRSIKPLYRVPDGLSLNRRSLAYKDADGKVHMAFELRSGLVQDVLPPTVHPDTGLPYTWQPGPPLSREAIPELPGSLLTLWEHWDELKPLLNEANPWAAPPKPPPASRPEQSQASGSVISAFNQTNSVRELLEQHGYVAKGADRFIAPSSKTRLPGVKLFTDGETERVFSHHGSDPLGGAHSHDSFGVYTILEHGGDVTAAVKAADELGLTFVSASSKASPADVKQHLPAKRWEERRHLPPTAPAVPTLPAAMVPAPLRPWIDDVADRLCVHREFVAVPAIVAVGATVGRTVGIHPKQHDDWLEVPNIWGADVGSPSSKKSPSIAEGTAPLDRLAAKAAEAYAKAQTEREADAEIIQLEIEALKKRARGKDANPADIRAELQSKLSELDGNDPPERRYYTSDATIEKIGMLLRDNPRGLLVKRDEGTGLLRTCDKPGHESDRAFYLEGYNGKGRFTIDRVGRGTLHVPTLTLSVLCGFQPGPLQSYIFDAISGERGADGLLQRFQLLVWPDRQRPYVNVDRRPYSAARKSAFRLFEFLDLVLASILPAKSDGADPDAVPALQPRRPRFV